MSLALTVRTVETIKPGPNRKEIPDRLLTGLYLVVQPSGARSWAVRYRSGVQTASTPPVPIRQSISRMPASLQAWLCAQPPKDATPAARRRWEQDHPPRHVRGCGKAIRRAALPTRKSATHHPGDAAAAQSACAAALAAPVDQGHHPTRCARPARRHRRERSAGRGQPCFNRHPQAVQLGRRA